MITANRYRAGVSVQRKSLLSIVTMTWLFAGLLAGCAASPTAPGGAGAPPSSADPAAPLAKWKSFPATATPRPLVITNGLILDPPTGFATGDQKLAYLAGQFELDTTLPASPATTDGYPVLPAKTALQELHTMGGNQQAPHPLRVLKAVLGRATFGTDRGPRQLPAWRFTLDGVTEPVQVLAVNRKQLWPAKPANSPPENQARLTGGGRSLTFSFLAGPAGPSPCGSNFAGDVTESDTAVVVSVHELKPNPQGSSPAQACTAIGAIRDVTVRLAAPLAGRVLLNSNGLPVPVTVH